VLRCTIYATSAHNTQAIAHCWMKILRTENADPDTALQLQLTDRNTTRFSSDESLGYRKADTPTFNVNVHSDMRYVVDGGIET